MPGSCVVNMSEPATDLSTCPFASRSSSTGSLKDPLPLALAFARKT